MTVPTPQPGYEWESIPTPQSVEVVEAEPATDGADRLAEQEIWRVLPSRNPAGGTLEPLSAEWFAHLEEKRYRRHGRWVTSLLELKRHAKENILAIGDGLGTDWVQMAGPDTQVTVVDPNSDRVKLQRKHFAVRGAPIQTVHAPWSHLPAPSDRTDVATLFFHETPSGDFQALADEIFRALRPGGKVMVVVPSRFNAERWQDLAHPWRWWRKPKSETPRFTAASLRQLFSEFEQVTLRKRHLRRSELPYLWRWLPLPVLERLMGRFMILKAFKPLPSTPPVVRLAA